MNDSFHPASNDPSLRLHDGCLFIGGRWTVRHLHVVETALGRLPVVPASLAIDLSGVQRMDTGGAALLQRHIETLQTNGCVVTLQQVPEKVAGLLALVREAAATIGEAPPVAHSGAVAQLGRRSIAGLRGGFRLVAFIGAIGAAWFGQLRHPRRIRWHAIADALSEAGHRALGIVGLLSFLLGIVIAYQGGVQLQQYGASLFVADLVGLSMVRELAPMITAIIVAGRTGSAYTAQIGTMQVTEEVDALRSLGISPMDMLVLPKLLALVVALPLLTVFADIMGVLGGMLMSSLQLEIAFPTFIERLGVAITLESFLVGIGKAPVFAAIIATIGCYQGFQVQGSAESVGRRTTVSVVHAILAVIVVDAAFSVAFSQLGI